MASPAPKTAPLNRGPANSATSTSGSAIRRCRARNQTPAIPPTARATSTAGVSASSSAAVLTAQTTGRIAAKDPSTLSRSRPATRRLRYSGTRRGASSTSTTITGTFTRNTEPHQKYSSSSPPTIGPSAIPPETLAVQIPIARVRSAGSGNRCRISDSVDGIRVAPPIPISARAPMSTAALGASAAASEAAPNRPAPMSSRRRRPIRSPRLPITISRPASRKPYTSRIQSVWLALGCSSAVIVGIAMCRIVMSIEVSSTGRVSTASPTHRDRSPAFVVVMAHSSLMRTSFASE